MAVLALIFAGFFGYALIVRDVAMWAKVVYFIWIGFVIGIILTIWVIKDMGFAEFIDPSESTSKDKTVYEDTEMPIPYHGGGGSGSTSSVGRSNHGNTLSFCKKG